MSNRIDRPSSGDSRTQVRKTRKSTADSRRNVLTVDNISNDKVPRWVNDVDNRISDMLDRGYEFVPASAVSVGDISVENTDKNIGNWKTKNVGKGITSYLMVQRKEWYEEDQKTKARRIDETESSLRTQNKLPQRYGKVDIE